MKDSLKELDETMSSIERKTRRVCAKSLRYERETRRAVSQKNFFTRWLFFFKRKLQRMMKKELKIINLRHSANN